LGDKKVSGISKYLTLFRLINLLFVGDKKKVSGISKYLTRFQALSTKNLTLLEMEF
jgi:hypothetical protein